MLDTLAIFPLDAMGATDKAFYVQLGARFAAARKAAGFTEVQLAEALGLAQQTLAHYEGGQQRLVLRMFDGLLSQAAR